MNKQFETTWCFFDLDGTLIKRDSYIPFLCSWLCEHPERFFHVLGLTFHILHYLISRKERSYIKQAFLSAFMKGATREDIDSFVKLFWEKFLQKYQNEHVMERLHWHNTNGHKIYIVTASFDFYTNHLVRLLPVNGIIATRAEWDGEVLTGKIVGENCRGHAKVRRIESELGIRLDSVSYYAYTDSESDIPLIEKAEHAVMVKSKIIERWSNPPLR